MASTLLKHLKNIDLRFLVFLLFFSVILSSCTSTDLTKDEAKHNIKTESQKHKNRNSIIIKSSNKIIEIDDFKSTKSSTHYHPESLFNQKINTSGDPNYNTDRPLGAIAISNEIKEKIKKEEISRGINQGCPPITYKILEIHTDSGKTMTSTKMEECFEKNEIDRKLTIRNQLSKKEK